MIVPIVQPPPINQRIEEEEEAEKSEELEEPVIEEIEEGREGPVLFEEGIIFLAFVSVPSVSRGAISGAVVAVPVAIVVGLFAPASATL